MFDIAIFCFLCLIWGSTWLAIKIGLEGMPPFLGAGLRFSLATIFLFFLTVVSRKWNFNFKGKWPSVIAVAFLIYPLPYGLIY